MFSIAQKRSFATFKKVSVAQPVVDIDGDEMTRVIWKWIKDKVSKQLNNKIIAYSSLY